MTPVVTLGIPDDLIRLRQIPPVDGRPPRFILRRDLLLEYFPDSTRSRIRNPDLLLLVIPVRGNERQLRPIFAPVNVVKAPAAGNIIAERRPMRIGRDLKPDNLRNIHFDNDPLDSGDLFVTRK